MNTFQALDTFMSGYLGPSCLYICGSDDVDKIIGFYIKTEPFDIHQELIDDIENYLTLYKNEEELTQGFYERYRHSIYKLPVSDFLKEVQRKIN